MNSRTCPHGTWDFAGALDQFWPDAFPNATNDSCMSDNGDSNQSSLDESPVP